ncbi:ras association domain-containing protein 10-like [Nerophis ophidion]|uniref:ras association domain-containing protein 10-like n=1 Tax=Nerophis ophidion TaxID=159077 RepID=UPI002ADF04EB|nr:ras association domain-containing protein 10-like [Nerophis ophidion]
MEAEEGKISVWVCREEKLVSGMTKRTTCADVVQVLLGDQNLRQGAAAGMLSGPCQSYCLVEKWRGFERILPAKTKILRLWSAWGSQQGDVRFVLLKNDASLPSNGPRSAEAKVVQSRENWVTPARTPNLSQERQRRIVRKAFRKLDKMNKKKEQTSVDKMETLVHLVVSQDHTIRQQVRRIQELDRDIESYEAKVHSERMKRHGANYVQDTYMDGETEGVDAHAQCTSEALEEHARRCEEVVRVHEELTARQALAEDITGEIQEELNRRWMRRRGGDVTQEPQGSHGDQEEEDRVKTQLDTSLYIGLRLKTDLDAVKADLDLSLAQWESKERELLELLAKVESVEFCDVDDRKSDEGAEGTGEKGSMWVEQARGLAKTCNDEDSDTGLSSMHSQDSDNPPVCESLV